MVKTAGGIVRRCTEVDVIPRNTPARGAPNNWIVELEQTVEPTMEPLLAMPAATVLRFVQRVIYEPLCGNLDPMWSRARRLR